MTDVSSTGAPHKFGFGHGEWREIIVEHEALESFPEEGIEALFIIRSAQGCCCQHLSFPAGKEG